MNVSDSKRRVFGEKTIKSAGADPRNRANGEHVGKVASMIKHFNLNENGSIDDVSVSSSVVRQLQDNSSFKGEKLESFLANTMHGPLPPTKFQDDSSVTPSMYDDVLKSIEENATINEAQLRDFVGEKANMRELHAFLGLRPSSSRQQVSGRRINSSRTLSASMSFKSSSTNASSENNPIKTVQSSRTLYSSFLDLKKSTSAQSGSTTIKPNDRKAKLTTGIEVTLIPDDNANVKARQLSAVKKDKECALTKLAMPLSCIGCVVGGAARPALDDIYESSNFLAWRQAQDELDKERLARYSMLQVPETESRNKHDPKQAQDSLNESSKHSDDDDSKEPAEKSDESKRSGSLEQETSLPELVTEPSATEEDTKRVSFLSDMLDQKEKIGENYNQAVDESVKRIKELLSRGGYEKQEESLKLPHLKQDMKESVKLIKEKLTHKDSRLRNESFEHPEAIFLNSQDNSESFEDIKKKSATVSKRPPMWTKLVSCMDFDSYDQEDWWDNDTFETLSNPDKFTYYDYGDISSYRRGRK